MTLKRLFDQAESTVNNAKYRAESLYGSLTNAAEDVLDYTSAKFLKLTAGIVGTYHAIKYAGLSIALITAPVPTLVGMAILWMMELSIDSVKSDIDHELKDKKTKREFNQVVKLLKKYGKVPETAVVETELVEMKINSVTGFVDGVVREGEFKGFSLSDIKDDDLSNLISAAPDNDTRALLESYVSYREKAGGMEPEKKRGIEKECY